jgi:hypothetical protein
MANLYERITYARTVYVLEVFTAILDLIGMKLNTIATGTDVVIVSREEIISFIDGVDDPETAHEYDSSDRVLADFLNNVETEITGEYGDVFFCK